MIDHFGINCSDLEASARFYDEVLGVLRALQWFEQHRPDSAEPQWPIL